MKEIELRKLMERDNISIRELARYLDVSKSAIERWRQSSHYIPENKLLDVCTLFGLPYEDYINPIELVVNDDSDQLVFSPKIGFEKLNHSISVNGELYLRIKSISKLTGHSMTFITKELLEFSIEKVRLLDK
ncbi:helix-turn-helix transcriptional regulator [Erysipelothrix sp. HDW6A]|uniref:helix-turn-helix domain-containing protein n=1 Tax=Erysipelothrix sp. HDW6A TaxID=2714928 RepID=UPI0014075C84|nr:helix-turn-helix transcriptional regulator [Erysipelothrix sp. HDW6A]QIK57799.1 helix-turn-helix transcriptional regulator [Erysipelothrix sp. HDW6A]